MTKRRLITAICLATILAAFTAHNVLADLPAAPTPIPVPPIPTPPQLGAPPKVSLPNNKAPGRPPADFPEPAVLDRLPIPPEAAITPADRNDPAPPPVSGLLTPAPASVSPGGSLSQIEEMLFVLDPGSNQLPPTAQAKLQQVASELAQNQAARLEVRIFSPSKPHQEGTAHRLSLARYFAIRDFLKRNGVNDARIDARPLVSDPGEMNADRAELYIER
ncbi:MAG TPA: OmpA family protein [Alphaproteobacteria bacterium]|nr:OmpA family protein [Alphaproteobacteria bacterium]